MAATQGKVSDNIVITTKGNYISASLFNEGIDSKLINAVSKKAYLVLADSTGKILAGTTTISGSSKLNWEGVSESSCTSGGGGGTLTVNLIKATETHAYMTPEDGNIDAHYFAIIVTDKTADYVPGLDGAMDAVTFADVSKSSGKFETVIVGELQNKPSISSTTNFQFNQSTINFKVS